MLGWAQDAKLCAGGSHVPAAFISIPPRMTFALRAAIGSLRCHGPREAIERPDKQQNRYQGNGNVYGAAHFCLRVAEAIASRRFHLGAPVAQIPRPSSGKPLMTRCKIVRFLSVRSVFLGKEQT